MIEALLAGVVAGYGIAIPVGAIAVLIVDTGMRCGFRCAAFAGAGAATADLLYAAVAVIGGAAVASTLVGVQTPVRRRAPRCWCSWPRPVSAGRAGRARA